MRVSMDTPGNSDQYVPVSYLFSKVKQNIILMAMKIWKCVLLEKAAEYFTRISPTLSPFDEGSLVRISLATAWLEIW